MIFGVTERSIYKRCRRQWYLSSLNHQALTPIIPRQALQIGSVYHQAQADWIADPQAHTLSDYFLQHANEEIDRIKQHYTDQIGAPPSDEELEDSYSSMRMGHAMCVNYESYWKTPLPEGFTLVAPEQVIIAPIPGSQHIFSEGITTIPSHSHLCLECPTSHNIPCDGQNYLEGTLDSLIRDDKGYLYVLERKTYENRPKLSDLQHNDQFLAYIWITQQLGIGDVAGVAYDGAWKRETPPKGRTLPDLFFREILRRPQFEVDEFQQHLLAETNEMMLNPASYINRRWEGCWDCGLEKLCTAISRDEDTEYVLHNEYTRRIREDYNPKVIGRATQVAD